MSDLATLEARLAELNAAATAREVWDAAATARGKAPTAPEATAKPTPPPGERPDAAAVRADLDRLTRADTVHKERAAAKATADTRLTAAEKAHATAETEAKRAAAWLAAVRRAPGHALAAGAEALGDLGPVTLDFPDTTEGGVAVTVTAWGSEWARMSTGQRLMSVAWLAAGVRRAMGATSLPIFVDDASLAQGLGEWPASRVVLLVSREGSLSVT